MIDGLKKKIKKADLVSALAQLALGGCNDAVKLLYLEPEELSGIDELDLRHISELKRSPSGAVEIRLTNRLELLKLLAGMLDAESNPAESFVTALDSAAAALGGADAD